MKKHALPVLVLAMVLTPMIAFAQTSNSLKADVPFDFMVGGKTIPAGKCIVRPIGLAGGTLQVANTSDNSSTFVVSNSSESLQIAEESVLVFHKYGDRYFLSSIRRGGSARGYQIPESTVEKELRAKNLSAPSEIQLAAK